MTTTKTCFVKALGTMFKLTFSNTLWSCSCGATACDHVAAVKASYAKLGPINWAGGVAPLGATA